MFFRKSPPPSESDLLYDVGKELVSAVREQRACDDQLTDTIQDRFATENSEIPNINIALTVPIHLPPGEVDGFCKRLVEEIEAMFTSIAGGFTTLNASGGWQLQDKIIRDRSRIVVAHIPITKWADTKQTIEGAIFLIQTEGKQKCVFLTVNQLSWGEPISLLPSVITGRYPDEPGDIDQHLLDSPDEEPPTLSPPIAYSLSQSIIGDGNIQAGGNVTIVNQQPGLTKQDLDSSFDLDKRVADLEAKLAALSLPDPTTTGMKEVEITPEQEAKIHEILDDAEELEEMGAAFDPWAEITLGHAARLTGELDAAYTYFQRAKIEFQKNQDRGGIAMSLNNLGLIAQIRGDLDGAEQLLNESLEISRELGHKEGIANALNNLGFIAQFRGDLDEAEQLLNESLEISRELGHKEGIAMSLGNLGLIAQIRGDLDGAEQLLNESLEISRELGHKEGIANALNNLGFIAQFRGDLDEAEQLLNESLEIKRELGHKEGIAMSLGNLGLIAEIRGDLDEAERLYRESIAIKKEVGIPLDDWEQEFDERDD